MMIRAAAPADAPALLAIYAPYVKKPPLRLNTMYRPRRNSAVESAERCSATPILQQSRTAKYLATPIPAHSVSVPPIIGRRKPVSTSVRMPAAWDSENCCMLNWSGFPLHRIFKIFTPALLSQKQQTPISLTTASNFTPIWGILSPENSITAAINSAPGIIWFGWKKYSVCTLCRPHRSCRSRS